MPSLKAAVEEGFSSFFIDPSPYFQALTKVKRITGILLHQQLWCFGKDIKNSKNNLLINCGFERVRPPEEIEGCTNYIRRIDGGASLVLWGFGIYYGYGSRKGVYLGRYKVFPELIHNEPLSLPIWVPSSLPKMKNPESIEELECSFRLMSELFDWIARYEEWVTGVMGGSYRERCLKDWDQPTISSNDAAGTWRSIASFYKKHLVPQSVSSKTLF